MNRTLNIVIPMAGAGKKFKEAGYSFPKPLIDVGGKPMIQVVLESLKTKLPHKYIFICLRDHFQNYSLNEIFRNFAGSDFEVITINGNTKGALCTALTAIDFINNDNDLLIANSDQVTDIDIDEFIEFGRKSKVGGSIVTFQASHPKWSYVKINKQGLVYEVAEKRVISQNATSGIYYFSSGKKFVSSAISMIEKDIKFNDEFFICPVYNEYILKHENINTWPIPIEKMHGLGTPEDLNAYIRFLENKNYNKN